MVIINNIIKFFPKHDNLLEPVPAKTLLPEWYKSQDSYGALNEPTIKRCIPVFDAMSSGYLLLAQSDITVDSTSPEDLLVNSNNDFDRSLFDMHDLSQYDSYPIPSGYHKHILRIDPMWAVSTPSGYSSLFSDPVHKDQNNLLAMPGMIDTDNFMSDGHLSFFVKSNSKFVIKRGTPIVQVIPVLRQSWESEQMSVEETKALLKHQDSLGIIIDSHHQAGAYKRIFHSQKSFK